MSKNIQHKDRRDFVSRKSGLGILGIGLGTFIISEYLSPHNRLRTAHIGVGSMGVKRPRGNFISRSFGRCNCSCAM